MGYPLAALAFAGPLLGSALAPHGDEPRAAPRFILGGALWSDVRFAELRAKDTDRIDFITAGEEQKSSFDQCASAADAGLCRILVSAVNVAAIIGSSIK
jgi:hypothetical protein